MDTTARIEVRADVRWVRRFALLIGWLMLAPLALAFEHEHHLDLPDLQVWYDSTGLADVQAVDALARSKPQAWRDLPRGALAAGYAKGAYWLRFTLAPPAGTWLLEIGQAYLDDLRFYEPDPAQTGQFRERRAGDRLAFGEREIEYRAFAFRLERASHEHTVHYLRVETSSTVVIRPRLLSRNQFLALAVLEGGLLLATAATLAVIVLLSLHQWYWLRDRISLWFGQYALVLALYYLASNGFLAQYAFPQLPLMADALTGITSALAMSAGNALYRRLLEVTAEQVWIFNLYRFATLFSLTPILAMPLGLYIDVMPLALNLNVIMCTLGVGLSWRLWRKERPGSGFVLIGNVLVFWGLTTSLAFATGLLPAAVWLHYSLYGASFINMAVLHVALLVRQRAQQQEGLRALAAERQERALREQQGQLLTMLAHELKTPLSVVRMAVGSGEASPALLAHADHAVREMDEVLERCLLVHKHTHGQPLQPHPVPCDLAALAQAAIAESADPDRFLYTGCAQMPLVNDVQLLHIIIGNLVENACKYGATTEPIVVWVGYEEGGPTGVVLRVCNAEGVAGRPDPVHVFDRYYRAPKAREITGSGLGLYLSAWLARQLGGELHYEPEVERLCFSLRLPIAAKP